ncbi:hypothetical protein KO361_01670 [Candidatus Woesearchaeota archaeon]|nr:hypothetical protein [Candidatus Woesearchaeota archaeon]
MNKKNISLASLIDFLSVYNFKSLDINFDEIQERLDFYDKVTKSEIKCVLSEYFVEKSLYESGFVFFSKDDVPTSNYDIFQNNHNLKFYRGSSPVFEFDFLGTYKDDLFIVESKSNSLKKYDVNKLDYLVKCVEKLFGERVNFLFLASFKNKDFFNNFSQSWDSHDSIGVVDMGFSKQDYDVLIKDYFVWKNGDSFDESNSILRRIKS